MPEADWGTALVIVAAATAFGLGFVLWLGRDRASGRPAEGVELTELEARRDSLVAQLQELQDRAERRDPDQLARERAELELEAAQVLRDLDQARHRPAAKAPAAGQAPAAIPSAARAAGGATEQAARPALRGFLWGVGSMAALALVFGLLFQVMSERPEGGSLTGTLPFSEGPAPPRGQAGGQGPSGVSDGDLVRLQAAVERAPDDLEARLDLTRALLMRQEMMEVFEQTEEVLRRQPGHPTALSYQAIVRMAMGQLDQAEGMLRQALTSDPNLLVGWVHLSLVYRQMGRPDHARAALDEALARHPQHAGMLQAMIRELDLQP